MTKHIPPLALNVVTLGVTDFARSVRFYEALGLTRKLRSTGDELAFFDAGGVVLALFRSHMLAEDALGGDAAAAPFAGRHSRVSIGRYCRCVLTSGRR